MGEIKFDLKMYFFIAYQLKNLHGGIQAGHSALRYVRKYYKTDPRVWDFIDNHETWIILDGGTTNHSIGKDDVPIGTLNQIYELLIDNGISVTYFSEPDLNDAMTAICFICDERVWNYKDYPEFIDYMINVIECDTKHYLANYDFISIKTKNKEELQQMYPEQYNIWLKNLGGETNLFLRELIKGKKLA